MNLFYDYNNYPFNIKCIKPSDPNCYVLTVESHKRPHTKGKCFHIEFEINVYNMPVPIDCYQI
jgi:hypothetical protein